MNSMQGSLMSIGVSVLCAGCAHPITIAPDLNRLVAETSQPRIERSVGYFIAEKDKQVRTKSPAGGGDSVEYSPYADLEPGLYRVLSNVFAAAYPVKDVNDRAFLESKNIAWVFTPTVTTTSSSRNNFFWPPTDFSVTLNCVAVDPAQQVVWSGTATASNDLIAVKETLKDHGLAGKSAAEKALKQLQVQLLAAPEFRK